MSHSQQIRNFVREKYIQPAILEGDRSVRVRAGDVHKAMRFHNRPALVCQALASKIFLEENNLTLEAKEGPPSGLSTSVVFTYRIGEPNQAMPALPRFHGLMQLSGIGKDFFAELGGGEKFLLEERRAFNESMERKEKMGRQSSVS